LFLILDSFEHLLDGTTLISDPLSRCPRLRVLVTSRAILGIPSEHVVEVKPLERGPAIALFVRQAEALEPAFALTPENGGVIGEICGRVDDLSALAGGRAAEVGADAQQVLASESVAQVRNLRHAAGAVTGIREVACIPHAAIHALRHRRGDLPDWVWRPAFNCLGSLLASVRRIPLALQIYGAAWAHQPSTAGDPRLEALLERLRTTTNDGRPIPAEAAHGLHPPVR